MIKRTIFIGSDAYLHTRHKQLHIEFKEEGKEPVSIPIEDIGVLVLEAYRLSLSTKLISRLLDNNVALITCDDRKMPQGMLLNLEGNHLQQLRFKEQINASAPLKKQLWAQTVKQKITNQGKLLVQLGLEEKPYRSMPRKMLEWVTSVRSGDPDNYEGRAAAYYWQKIFKQYIPDFTRDRGGIPPNNWLNYGYAILRAVTARSLTASGLLPTLGIHHHNKYNAFALADDVMEPYRPYVDKIVYDILSHPFIDLSDLELNKERKAALLQIPAMDVIMDGKKSPLMNAMQRTTASLYQCFAGNSRKILYPEMSD
jgi:CRISPR-associated protein Cas1